MGDDPSTVMSCARASETWVAKFKTSVATSAAHDESVETSDPDVRALAVATYNARLSGNAELLGRLEQLHAKLLEDKAHCAEFRKLGGIPLIIHHMATNLCDKELQISSCDLLASLASDGVESQDEIGEKEGIEAVFDALNKFHGDARMQMAAIGLLRTLTFNESRRAVMLKYGIFQFIVSALEDHMDDEKLVEMVVSTVAAVVYGNQDARAKFGELGGIALITRALRTHECSVDVQSQAAVALRNLAFECDSNLAKMNEADTLEAMFRSLENHAEHPLVANQILAAIGNVASKNSTSRARILSEKSYIAQLFRVLAVFVNDSDICKKLCTTLHHVSDHGARSDRSSACTVASCCIEVNGSAAIVNALRSSSRARDVVLISSIGRLISVLCTFGGFRKAIGDAEALPVLLQSMCENPDKEEAVGPVLEGICSILSGNDDNKRIFSKLCGMPAVVQVMDLFTENRIVTEKCCKVLDIAAEGQTATTDELVVDRETPIEKVNRSMMKFPGAARLQEYGCSMLIKFANVSRLESAHMRHIGVQGVVEVAIKAHVGNPAVESLANQLLSILQTDRSSRSTSRGKTKGSSSRMRSRSRTIGERARSRNNRSKSPVRSIQDRGLNAGRRAMLEAKAAMDGESKGIADKASPALHASPENRTRKTSRTMLALEPVFE